MADEPTVPWQVMARTPGLVEQEHCAGYTSLSMDLRWLDVGTWQLELPIDHYALGILSQRGAGIVVRATGAAPVVMSGFVTEVSAGWSGSESTGVTVSGVTDDAVLAGEVVYPSPGLDIAPGVVWQWPAAASSKSGPGETVLLSYISEQVGPAAAITRRRYPWLTIPASLGRGSTVTRSERLTSLLDVATAICTTAGLGVTVRQAGQGTLAVLVTVPQVRADAVFSAQVGNVVSLEVARRAPQVDEVIVGGESSRQSRVFARQVAAGAPAWKYRRARFVDSSGTSVLAEMQAAADEQLTQDGEQVSARVVGRDVPGIRYGVHYALGDRVPIGVPTAGSGIFGSSQVLDVVSAVRIEHAANRPSETTVTIGPLDDDSAAADAALRRLATAVLATLRR